MSYLVVSCEALGRGGEQGRQSAFSQEEDLLAQEPDVLQTSTSIHFNYGCDRFYLILVFLDPIVSATTEN